MIEIAIIINVVAGIIFFLMFLGISQNLGDIKRTLRSTHANSLLSEYSALRSQGRHRNNEQAAKLLYEAYWSYLFHAPDSSRKRAYKEFKLHHLSKFEEAGVQFPEYGKSFTEV